jgi:plasmid rolling circle replication initiator protein Rep
LPDAGKREGNAARRYRQLSKETLAKGLDAIGRQELALRVRNCCTTLYRDVYEHGERFVAHECGVSVCPDWQRRKARDDAADAERRIVRLMEKHPGSKCIMLTGSLGRAIPAHELKAGVGKLISTYAGLMRRVPVKRAVLGWVRNIELARHPSSWLWGVHFHSALIVPADYFKRGAGLFLHQEAWAAMLQKQLRIDYRPVVDVRVLQGVQAPLDDEGRKSLREVVKYCTKPSSLVRSVHGRPVLVGSDDAELYDVGDGQGLSPHLYVPLRAVIDATHRRRMLSYSRNLEAADELELEFGELPEDVEAGTTPKRDLGAFICCEIYVWRARGRDADFFLVSRTFDKPKGRCAMPP